MWLNRLDGFERVSTVFNIGTEYDFLRVVCSDIQRYYCVCSLIVKIKKTKGSHFVFAVSSLQKLIATRLTCKFHTSEVAHTNKLISLFPALCQTNLFCLRCYSIIVYPMKFHQDVLSWPEGGAIESFLL